MKKIKPLVKLGLTVLLLFVVLSVPALLVNNFIKVEEIRHAVSSFGILAPVIFIISASISNILPSVAALPFWLVGVSLFGFPGYVYILISNTLGAMVNYFMAKKFGRRIITKLAGTDGLREVDKLTEFTSVRTLFYIRLVGGALSDYISYTAGLMKINLYTYIITTILGSLPMMLLAFFVINESLKRGVVAATGLIGIFYIINYLSALLVIPLIIKHIKH